MTVTHDQYVRAIQRMLAATEAWAQANRGAKLDFRPLGFTANHTVGASLNAAMIRRVCGNAKARELLRVMAAALGDGTPSLMMAECCLDLTFGTKRPLSVGTAPALIHVLREEN